MRFLDDAASNEVRNVVVDGAPNAGTVLTLTHWPGIVQPSGLAADLSAQMAFKFLRRGDDPHADVVTNNHFDQDGLVGIHALVYPELSLAHEALLVDVAAAGDFATFRHREAARASMALHAYGDEARSPIADQLVGRPYAEQCALLYETTLPLLLPMVLEPERFRDLWVDDDASLTASEAAIADGRVTITEHPQVDLAVVHVPEDEPARSGHRFAHALVHGVHPMALHNATECLRILVVHGRRYRYVDRYETWVQYRSRLPLSRVDLEPLATALTAAEPGSAAWSADAPSVLTPELTHTDESGLDETTVVERLVAHLRSATPAWNPYA
jgi:hypothetical protein